MAENTFPDFNDALAAQAQQLARRRALAQSLIQSGMTQANGPAGEMVSGIYVPNHNGIGSFLNAAAGSYMNSTADREQADTAAKQAQAQQSWQADYANAPDDATRQKLLSDARNKGLRYDLEQQFTKAEQERAFREQESAATRTARAEQTTADREARAEAARLRSEDARLSIEQRREAAREAAALRRDIAAMRGAGGPGAGAAPAPGEPGSDFAGPATVVGINPRDESPIYRHTKSGRTFRFDENGNAVAHDGAIGPKTAATTESERTASGYLGRMTEAEKILNAQGAAGQPSIGTTLAGKVPGVGGYAQRNIMTEAQGKAQQAQQDWVRAKLRKESGAVIGEKEMADEIAAYFPQVGDSKAVIAQKAQSRMQAQEQMKASAGRVKPTIAAPVARTVVREVKLKDGRTGVEYSDGTRGFK